MLPSGKPAPNDSSVLTVSGMSSANFTASRKAQSMRCNPRLGLACRVSSLTVSMNPRSVLSLARPIDLRGGSSSMARSGMGAVRASTTSRKGAATLATDVAIGSRKSATADFMSKRRFWMEISGNSSAASPRLQSQSITRSLISLGMPTALSETPKFRSACTSKSAVKTLCGLDSS